MDGPGTRWPTGVCLGSTAIRWRRRGLCLAACLVLSACTYNPEEGVQWTAERDRHDQGVVSGPSLPELPAYPSEANLVRIDLGVRSEARNYLVDVKSVTNAAASVIRYTVVIEERSGAQNVFYEGLRCRTKDVKRYAYATPDGRFQRRENARWLRIPKDAVLGYQAYLYRAYFCDEDGFTLSEREIRGRLLGNTWTDDPALGE